MARSAGLLAAALVLALAGSTAAADSSSLAGRWKLILPLQQSGQQPLWLIQLEEKEGKWQGKMIDTATGFTPLTLERARVDADVLHLFTVRGDSSFHFE